MINAALLHPANRLLNGGTADFAMFGGQPSVTLDISRAAGLDGGYVTAFRTQPSNGQTEASSAPVGSFPVAYSPASETTASIDDGLHSGGFSSPVSLNSAAVTAPQAPAPSGAGSTAPSAPLDGPLAHVATAASPVHDAAVPVAGAFSIPVIDGSVSTLVSGAPSGLATVDGLIIGALASVDAVRDDLVETITGTVTASASVLADLGTTVGYLAGNALDHVAAATTHVGDVAATTVEVADATVGSVTSFIGAAVDPVHDSVTGTVLPLVDHLASGTDGVTDVLAGSDPAGGIATLTNMVGSADVFELSVGTVPAVDAAVSALDEIAPDAEAAVPLLGDDHGLGDILHGGHDHGLGL